MRVVLQRVTRASVSVENQIVGQINIGFLVLLGITNTDTQQEVDWLVNKLLNLRVFADSSDKMNLSVKDIEGSLLIVSQFTLYADSVKGNRPSFTQAASPEFAEGLYNRFIEKCESSGLHIQTGQFGAVMEIELTNDGPVTIILEK